MTAEMGLTTKDWKEFEATVCTDGGISRTLRGRVLETMGTDKKSRWRQRGSCTRDRDTCQRRRQCGAIYRRQREHSESMTGLSQTTDRHRHEN